MAEKLSFQSEFITARENLYDAKSVLINEWNAMSTVEKGTWLTNKQFTKDTDGLPTFLDYFLRTFSVSNVNTNRFTTILLSGGTSKNYVDRVTRTWSVA